MLFKTADWDDSAQTHNALATESKLLSYQIVHEFNRPARATFILADPDGSTSQKYDVDAANDSVYIGPGRVYLEDPTGTAIFEGRIIRAVPDLNSRHLVLECEDWLGQLNDERINYDMREDLDGSGLRQSVIHTDPDSGVYVGPAYQDLVAVAGSVNYDINFGLTDYTADANDAGANDVGLMQKLGFSITVGNYELLGFTTPSGGVRATIGIAGTGNYVLGWYYSKGGGSWGALTVTDGTNSWKTAGTHDITWDTPSDWATDTIAAITAYWVKAVIVSGSAPWTAGVGTQFWQILNYVWDDNMIWAADAYNGKYLMFAGGMAGTITVGTGPYQGSATGADGYSNDPHVTWVDDGTVDLSTDNDASYNQDYDFRVYVGNNTPSDFYVHDSITSATITLCYLVTGDCTCKLQIDDKTNGWIDLEDLNVGFGVARRLTVQVPSEYLGDIIDANGIASVRFALTWGSGDVSIAVKYLWLEVAVSTTGYSEATYIHDTLTNYLAVATDFTAAATRIWEGVPYAIAQPIYKHIDTGESGTLVTNGDVVYAMTAAANIEHTSGISTRHFIERTRLEIIQALAIEDKVSFFVPLGTVALTWKSTFNDGTPTALTDTSVLTWQGDWNYDSMFNTVTAYGARIGTYQIEASDEDATSVLTYGINKTKIEKNTGVLNDYDCVTLAEAIVTQDKDVRFYLQAELPGLSTLRLGDEVSITSTYLGLTAQVYTITHWAYDSAAYKTSIRLHPRASTTGYQKNLSLEGVRMTNEMVKTGTADKYVADLSTQEWTSI